MQINKQHLTAPASVTSADLLLSSPLDYVFFRLLSWFTPFPSLPCPSPGRFTYGLLSPHCRAVISSLPSSLLCSSSPDVGAGPGGSCCSLQFVSVKHQLVSQGVCAQFFRTQLRLWTFTASHERERKREREASIGFHSQRTQRGCPKLICSSSDGRQSSVRSSRPRRDPTSMRMSSQKMQH